MLLKNLQVGYSEEELVDFAGTLLVMQSIEQAKEKVGKEVYPIDGKKSFYDCFTQHEDGFLFWFDYDIDTGRTDDVIFVSLN